MKNVVKEKVILIVFIIVGLFLIIREAKFYIDVGNGKYEKIPATIVGYKGHTSHSGKHRRTYRKIYEYELDGETKRYTSFLGSNSRSFTSIGNKVTLYRNIKTNKVREEPSKATILLGIIFTGIGIVCMFISIRKENRVM